MALIYPITPPDGSPNSELKVRRALASIPDLIAFHSVGWQSKRNGRPGDGEADFIILVPNHGILILEVKGGGIEIRNGVWHSTGADGTCHRIKDPFIQAMHSKHALLEYFRNTRPNLDRIPIFHGVCFPDVTVTSILSMASPRDLILDRFDLMSPANAIRRIAVHWKMNYDFGQGETQDVVGLLAPSTYVQRVLRDEVSDAREAILHLTAQQTDVLRCLGKNRRALIMGCAGTGKTILAMEKAKQLSTHGLKCLLVCFNAPLKEYLSRVMNGLSVDVESFHSLVNREMKKANIRSSVHRNKEWFDQQSAGDLLDALRINGTVYDALLVDETQDFRIEWLEALLFMAKNEASIVYLFGDSHQDLYAREWIPPKDFAQFELTVNCRNTTPIAKKVCRIFGDDITCNAAQGPEPQFIEVQGIEQGIKQVSLILDRILNIEGLSPNQIVVLSDSKYLVDELRKTKIGDYNMTDLTGVGIPVETIYRFKGLEQDVVVLFLTDAAINSRIKQLAYVGLSRAKSILYILGSASIRRGFSWE